jgi:hypothetical protein
MKIHADYIWTPTRIDAIACSIDQTELSKY